MAMKPYISRVFDFSYCSWDEQYIVHSMNSICIEFMLTLDYLYSFMIVLYS